MPGRRAGAGGAGLIAAALLAGAAEAVAAAVLPVDTPPVLDGALDEPFWERAVALTGFRQIQPVAGAAPTVRTEVRFASDGRTLFVGIRAFDPAPERIVARQMQRDVEALEYDDHVAIVLDPGRSRRNGYLFLVNANGAQRDALIFDGASQRADWDAIWDAAARVDAQGWSAELAIPLAVFADGSAQGDWGVNAERWIARSSEWLRWRAATPDKQVSSLQDAGVLAGMPRDAPGVGLRVKPHVSLRAQRPKGGATGTRLEPGADVFYRVAPGVTATLTLNADFAETEVDDRLVNLTRFPLFFPEKREFFLQDAGFFSFGGVRESPLPFFSRRVGLDDDGRPLAIEGGVKLTGATDRLEFGVFGARVEASPGQPAPDVGVARLAGVVGPGSRLGVIGTVGNPQGTSGSDLAGIDYQYRNTQLPGGRTLGVFVWGQESGNAQLGRGRALGASVDFPNVGWTGNAQLQRLDAAYLPALGFVEETGIRRFSGEFGYWHRTAAGGSVIPQFDWLTRDGLDDARSSRSLNPEVYFENAAGDFVFPEAFFERERLVAPFEVLPGIVVPPGEYEFTRAVLGFGTSQSRALSVEGELAAGGFYDGDRYDAGATLRWRPSARWGVQLRAARNDVDLPQGRFIVRVGALRLDYTPSTRLAFNLLLQYDNVSENAGVNARARWTIAPGRDLYFVVNQGIDTRTGFANDGVEATLKLVWNWML